MSDYLTHRGDECDPGEGHSFSWLYARGGDDPIGPVGEGPIDATDPPPDPGRLIGLIEHHPDLLIPEAERGDSYCGGYVAWINDPHSGTVAKHQLVEGGPDAETGLTIHPSLLCRRCGNHGWIKAGRWESA